MVEQASAHRHALRMHREPCHHVVLPTATHELQAVKVCVFPGFWQNRCSLGWRGRLVIYHSPCREIAGGKLHKIWTWLRDHKAIILAALSASAMSYLNLRAPVLNESKIIVMRAQRLLIEVPLRARVSCPPPQS